jgi:phage protein D
MTDRSVPGIRIAVVPNERSAEIRPVSLDGRVLGFTFEDSEKKTDKVTLQLNNHDLSLFDNEALFGGVMLEVSFGYPENMSPPRRVVLKKIKGFNPLTVEGHASSILLNRKTRTRCWENKRHSDVARDIAAENGFEGAFLTVESTEPVLDVINQAGETDAQFLRRLARDEGFEFWVDDTGFHWHERRLDLTPTHRFEWRTSETGDILSIHVESDLMRRAARIKVKARDPYEKATIEESATNDTVDRATLGESREVVEVVDVETGDTVLDERNSVDLTFAVPADNPEKARQKAARKFKRAERRTVKLSMQVVGDPTLRAKSIVEVQGISKVLSGKYYVKEVKHTISSAGYISDLKLIRDAKGVFSKRLAQEQKGRRNQSAMRSEKEVRQFVRVDPETGMETVEYYQGDQYYGYEDVARQQSIAGDEWEL